MRRILAVTNMYPTSRDPTLGTFVEQQIQGLKQVGLDTEVVLLDRLHKGMSVYLATGRRVRAAIRDFQPDIVHAMYGGVMADVVTAAANGRPTLVSFCGDDLLGELLSGPVRKVISQCGILSSYRAARRAHGIVVKSKNLHDVLPHDIPRSKIRIIPNGIDLERFKPLGRISCRNRLGWRNDCLNVLFSANSGDPRKRPELAWATVKAAELLGFKIDMHSLRDVPHDQVPVWLNASDAVLLTSLHEGSPNVIKEALACNVPVVSVDVGDVRERIQGINGCYIASADPNDLASKLKLVHAGPRRVDSRNKVQNLSLEHVALRLKEFYEEVLLSWKANHPNSSIHQTHSQRGIWKTI
jgi:teichuronic acid biosynthesis glycosyltransferase TuaC